MKGKLVQYVHVDSQSILGMTTLWEALLFVKKDEQSLKFNSLSLNKTKQIRNFEQLNNLLSYQKALFSSIFFWYLMQQYLDYYKLKGTCHLEKSAKLSSLQFLPKTF